MLKKILCAFVFVMAILATKQVNAVSVNDVISFEIGQCTNLVEVKVGETWEIVPFDKVNANGLELFKLGNNHNNGTELIIKKRENLPTVLGVIKNGYGNVPASTYGITEDNDFYLATKIAINSAYLGHEITDDYRKMEILNYTKVPRAEAVMKAAEAMLNKGKEFAQNSASEVLELVLLSEEKIQSKISRIYKVKYENIDFKGYNVSLTSDNEIEYNILDNVTGEEKTDFLEAEDCFKVVIPEEKSSSINVEVKAEIHADRLFIGNDNKSDYIVYSEQDEIVSLSDEFEIIYQGETEEKPEDGSGETEESDGTGEGTDNSSGGEDNSDNEGNDTDEGENKGDTDTKEPEEDSSKPEGANPDDEEIKEELNPGEGESEEKEPDKPKDEILGDIDGDKDGRRRQ